MKETFDRLINEKEKEIKEKNKEKKGLIKVRKKKENYKKFRK